MTEHLGTEKPTSILDWLQSVPAAASSQLFLENIGGPASPPQPSQLFPPCSSPVSHTHHPLLCTTPRMAYNFPDHEFSLSQAFTNGGETPFSSHTSRSPRALSAESPSQRLPEKLRFLGLDEWDEHNTYEEDVPTCLHYSIK